MATSLSELTMLMNYEDRQRARLESQERQDSRDNWSRFTTMAAHNVSTADDITNLAKNETDLTVLDELSKKLEGTLTGVNFVDQVINVKGAEIDNRKNTVVAGNKISDQINSLNEKLGNEKTAGVKEALDALDKQYRNMVSSMTNENKILLANKLTNVKEHFNLQLWKGEFDTDKELEGNQFPEWMGEHEKSFYTQTVEPGIRVAEAGGDYTDSIKQLQDAFPTMRREKTAYQTVNQRMDKAAEVDADKAAIKEIGYKRTQKINEISGHLSQAKAGAADLTIDNNDMATQKVWYSGLATLDAFSSSMTDENLQNLDVLGAIRAIDRSIIINSIDDPDDLRSLLPKYTTSDPLEPTMRGNIEKLIVRNTMRDDKTKEITGYTQRYGKSMVMFDLIQARKLLIDFYLTPGMVFRQDETDTTIAPASKSVTDKLKTKY
jgi:hypothetical protein